MVSLCGERWTECQVAEMYGLNTGKETSIVLREQRNATVGTETRLSNNNECEDFAAQTLSYALCLSVVPVTVADDYRILYLAMP